MLAKKKGIGEFAVESGVCPITPFQYIISCSVLGYVLLAAAIVGIAFKLYFMTFNKVFLFFCPLFHILVSEISGTT